MSYMRNLKARPHAKKQSAICRATPKNKRWELPISVINRTDRKNEGASKQAKNRKNNQTIWGIKATLTKNDRKLVKEFNKGEESLS